MFKASWICELSRDWVLTPHSPHPLPSCLYDTTCHKSMNIHSSISLNNVWTPITPSRPLSNMDNSPLSRLSGELRNMIYTYLWPSQTEAVICLCGRHHPLRPHLSNPKAGELWTYTGSHLPRVCRQLRHETLGYFFSSSDFVLPLRYILQANEQFRLEDEWERFVGLYGVEAVRLIKRMSVLAGKINKVVVERPRRWAGKRQGNRALIERGFAVSSGVDLQCGFARRSVRPCLHPAASMLVVFEHREAEDRRTCIDFDDREATAARIRSDVPAENRHHESWTWEGLWPELLAKWYGDEVLDSGVAEDTILDLMLVNDVSDEAAHHHLDCEALAGLLNIVRARDLGEDAEISTDDFLDSYSAFSGRQMAFSSGWEQTSRRTSVAIDMPGDSGALFRSMTTRYLRSHKRTPEGSQDVNLANVISLPEMRGIF